MTTKRYAAIKRSEDVELTGISVELALTEHGTVQDLTLRDEAGHELRIRSQYGIEVQVPAKPKMVDRFALSGSIPGIRDDVLEYFETESAARHRMESIDEKLRIDTNLKVEAVRITEEQADLLDGDRLAEKIPF